MERAAYKTKLSRALRGREMKRVADTGEQPIVVPVVVVAVDVHLALVVPTIERGIALYRVSSRSLPSEYSKGLYRIWHLQCLKTPYQVASFLKCLHVLLYPEP